MKKSAFVIPHSILDLAPIPEGTGPGQALRNSLDLARHAEDWGYERFWLAEHHNMPGIASAATSVVIGYVLGGTKRIRVGAGGIMLPNHAPLVIAEQFGTLASLYPGRVDLGVGRAPGTDMGTARALRRGMEGGDTFPRDVLELIGYFADDSPDRSVRAVPGLGTHVPVWILGSSLYGAQLAAKFGLPYAFASHFAPTALTQATQVYRETFRASDWLKAPRFMMAINVFAGETDEEGAYLKTSAQQAFANLRTGRPGKLPRPVRDIDAVIDPAAKAMANEALSISATGSPATVRRELDALIERYKPDEIILTGLIHEHAARLRSFQIAALALRELALTTA